MDKQCKCTISFPPLHFKYTFYMETSFIFLSKMQRKWWMTKIFRTRGTSVTGRDVMTLRKAHCPLTLVSSGIALLHLLLPSYCPLFGLSSEPAVCKSQEEQNPSSALQELLLMIWSCTRFCCYYVRLQSPVILAYLSQLHNREFASFSHVFCCCIKVQYLWKSGLMKSWATEYKPVKPEPCL